MLSGTECIGLKNVGIVSSGLSDTFYVTLYFTHSFYHLRAEQQPVNTALTYLSPYQVLNIDSIFLFAHDRHGATLAFICVFLATQQF